MGNGWLLKGFDAEGPTASAGVVVGLVDGVGVFDADLEFGGIALGDVVELLGGYAEVDFWMWAVQSHLVLKTLVSPDLLVCDPDHRLEGHTALNILPMRSSTSNPICTVLLNRSELVGL